MLIAPMLPHPFNSNMETFKVSCFRCNKMISSADVSVDLEGEAFRFYCQHCICCVIMDHENATGELATWYGAVQ